MNYDDDEPINIVAPPDVSALEAGETELTIINKPEAPLEETELKVLVELTVSGDKYINRYPVDLVMVLDVSRSMNEERRIEKLKIAMQFVIKKLSRIDRLSVVTFSADSKRLFPLRQITGNSQDEIIALMVNALVANGGTNIAAGLKKGLKVLNGRRLKDGRVGAIMLMSDGEQNAGGDAAQVQFGNFAVHTFAFGSDADPKVLQEIARKSSGGTFSDVRNQNDLTKAFSQCLAGLLTVVVRDLKLTIQQVNGESEIKNVSAGNYEQTKNNDGSVTISFGDLYNKEVRKVLVDLLLPKVDSQKSPDVLQITYTGSACEGPSEAAIITRSETASDRRIARIILEEDRLKAVNNVKEARIMAENRTTEDLEELKDKVVEAQNLLEDVEVDDGPNQSIEMLIFDLQELFDLMGTQKRYEKQGRAYAMSFETCHDRQRYAARGDMDEARSFATPRMNAYLEQAMEFDKDPINTNSPPSVEDDEKRERKEILDDPSIPYYIKLANLFDRAIKSNILLG